MENSVIRNVLLLFNAYVICFNSWQEGEEAGWRQVQLPEV